MATAAVASVVIAAVTVAILTVLRSFLTLKGQYRQGSLLLLLLSLLYTDAADATVTATATAIYCCCCKVPGRAQSSHEKGFQGAILSTFRGLAGETPRRIPNGPQEDLKIVTEKDSTEPF